METLGVD